MQTNAAHSWGGEQPDIRVWYGGLVDGMRDASGQMYMRNRYYDPATGQFTQTDPIGIAGGLNAYGFAAGDPVSYSDPFGLSPCSELRDDIDATNEDLQGYIRRYESWKAAGDATSGHLEAIEGKQNRLRRLQRRYIRQEKCQDDDDHDDWSGWGMLQSLLAYTPPPFDRDFSHGYTPRYQGATQNNPIRLPEVTVTANEALAASSLLLVIVVLAPAGV